MKYHQVCLSIYWLICIKSIAKLYTICWLHWVLNMQAPGWQHNILTWWRHQMETFSALLALCAGNSLVSGEFPLESQWRGALMFSLICPRINAWVNDSEAGDLRRYRAHYDVTVMSSHGSYCQFLFHKTPFQKKIRSKAQCKTAVTPVC